MAPNKAEFLGSSSIASDFGEAVAPPVAVGAAEVEAEGSTGVTL